MTDSLHLLHPEAIPHLPVFITAPGETDVLFVVNAIFVLLAVSGLGVFYFKLHALPEQLAHRGQKIQFQIVAVLGLLALFTHNHAFWIAGLLLALVPLPDFTTPLGTIARSLERRPPRHRLSPTRRVRLRRHPRPRRRRPPPTGRSSRRRIEPCWNSSSVRC